MRKGFNFHWQNLNEKPAGRMGSPLRNGRAWLRVFGVGLNWQWVWFGGDSAGVTLRAAQSEDIGFYFHFGLPFVFSLYWTLWGGPFARLASWLLKRSGARYDDREISLRFFDTAVWWYLWHDPDSWSSGTPRWRCGSFHFDDFLLGSRVYSERTLSEHATRIAMPEGEYDATVRLLESTWKRPRWFAKRLVRSEVSVPNGIPFPGKGENSWDCGEDALFSQTSTATTVEKAIANVVESVLRSRRRNGGSVNWRPLESSGVA